MATMTNGHGPAVEGASNDESQPQGSKGSKEESNNRQSNEQSNNNQIA